MELATRRDQLEPSSTRSGPDLTRALSADGRRARPCARSPNCAAPGSTSSAWARPATGRLYVQVLDDDAEKGQGAIPSKVEVRGLVELLRETLVGMPGVTRVRWTVPSPWWPGRRPDGTNEPSS